MIAATTTLAIGSVTIVPIVAVVLIVALIAVLIVRGNRRRDEG